MISLMLMHFLLIFKTVMEQTEWKHKFDEKLTQKYLKCMKYYS